MAGRSGSKVSLIIGGGLLLLASIASAQRPQAEPKAAPARATDSSLLVTGLPSVIELPRSLGNLLSEPPVCVTFSVRSIDRPAAVVRITSTGMSDALLLDLGGAQNSLDCNASRGKGNSTITLSNVGQDERPVRLVLPSTAFPANAKGAKGTLLVLLGDRAPVRAEISLLREDHAPLMKAFLWFFGIAIPALLTAVVGLAVYRAQKVVDVKSAEAAVLDNFRRQQATELKRFFGGLYAAIAAEPAPIYTTAMERELGQLRILSALPRRSRDRLLDALKAADREKVAVELSKAFPDLADAIRKPLIQS